MKNKLSHFLIFILVMSVGFSANGSSSAHDFEVDNVIYVNGERHTLSKSSFQKLYRPEPVTGFGRPRSSYTYIVDIPVLGDIGQELIFDIDLKIKGRGSYDSGFRCYLYEWGRGVILDPRVSRYPSPRWIDNNTRRYLYHNYELVDSGTPPNCVETKVEDPGHAFHFSMAMNVFCNDNSLRDSSYIMLQTTQTKMLS